MLAHTQFTAIVLMTLLALKLLLLPNKVAVNNVTNKSRWLMTCGIILIDVQFMLQYALGLRSMGVTQAVMLNLVMFIPVSWMMSVAILYLQRQGRVTTLDKVAGLAAWIAAVALIAVAAAIDGQPLLSSTPELRNAEIAASVCYSIMQIYYTAKHSINLVKMHSALQNYYDSDKMELRWMQFSVVILMVLAIMTPILIFGSGLWLAVYALFFYGGIFYFVDSFCGYVVSSAPQKMQVAEANETFEENNATSGNDVAAADPENVETQQESLEESSL